MMSEPTIEVPGYRVLDKIHAGGQGIVYRAVQIATQRVVALKILDVRHTSSEAQRNRFQREIELTARLRHPHIVTVYDSGVHGAVLFYAMEYIEGQTLDAYLEETPLDLKQRTFLFAKIAAAVGYAHEHFVFHRDLKPGNILVDVNGEPHVLDFGLAKIRTEEDISSGERVTRPGEFLGTLAYAAPEQTQVDADLTSRRTDVYALGVVFYEGLSGQRPYPYGGGVHRSIRYIVETPPRPLSSLGDRFDDDLSKILMKALAKDPMRRYVTAGEFADDLHRYLDGQPVRAKRDSTAYIVWKSVRRVVASSSKSFLALMALVAAIASQIVKDSPRAFEADTRLAAIAQSTYKRLHGKAWSDRVIVVGMNDETTGRIEAIANSEKLPFVSASNFFSWRSVHGAWMQRIARVRPSVVTWDVAFVGQRPLFDGHFTAGAKALHDAGSKIVVAADRSDRFGRPLVSSTILEASDAWGWLDLVARRSRTADNGERPLVFATGLFAIDPKHTLTPTLSLATYAAHRQPHATPRYVWESPMMFAHLYYEIDPFEEPIEEERVLVSLHMPDFAFERATPEMPKYGMIASLTTLPSVDVLGDRTVAYHDVFEMDDATLRETFEGRIVVVGDLRENPGPGATVDRTRIVDGRGCFREAFAVYVHATGVSDLVSGSRFFRAPALAELLLCFLVAAAGGSWVRGCRVAWRSRAAVALVFVGTLACIAVVFVIAAIFGVAFSPTATVAVWITGLASGTLIGAIERRSKPWLRPAPRLSGIPTPTPTPGPAVSTA